VVEEPQRVVDHRRRLLGRRRRDLAAVRGFQRENAVTTAKAKRGRGVQLEILDAQVSLTGTRFNAVSGLADCNTALAMWLRATGRVR
jgi:hypothetical protein